MKKKKLVLLSAAAVLSLAVAGSIGATVASAETINQDSEPNTGSTTVTYQVDSTWEVTIPESIELQADGSETTADVSANGVKIEKDQKLTVKVESKNNWEVTDTGEPGGNGFAYQVSKEDGTVLDNDSNNTVLEVEAGTDGDSETLKAKLKDATDAGKYSTGEDSYTDELTFTVEVA